MYLQSLEIAGFKSFAQKTTLNFHRGVTAIVGPNGCGKSNVLDAMRWVLGEQSAKALRGGEMADVIFSGTDSRQALGMAEVSLTFAECEKELGLDYNEVRITRRVFRDGRSEYFLNKTPCRLRDIHQLFMDTGIGRSAYSIMEQGKIDQILSSKPEDRRAIFEEAAGITKFKSQKKEALRKLEATEANLLRLTDVIKEVKRQIGSLQRQAGKARRYQSLLSDLKLLETHAAKRQFDELEVERERVNTDLKLISERQAQGELEIEQRESEVAAQRAAIADMEQQLNGARQSVNDLKTRISNHENRIIFNRERSAEFTSLIERYTADISSAEEKFRIAETQLRDTDAELEQITTMLASELRHMEEKQAAAASLMAQRQEAEQGISALTREAGMVESLLSSLRGQIATVAQQKDSAEARLGMLSSELEQLNAAETRLSEQNAKAQEDIATGTRDLEERTVLLSSTEAQLRDAQAQLAAVDQELRSVQRLLSEKDSRLEVLVQLVEGGEGLGEGTQALLRGLDNPELFKPSIGGALASMIEVESAFIPAIEAALGQNLQAVLMKDTTIAEAVLRTMAAKKCGRASIIVREFLPAGEAQNEFLPQGALAWAVDRVKADGEAGQLLRALLTGVAIVETIDKAFELHRQARTESRRLTLVTLAGEVLTHEGIVHGGTAGDVANSVLERKNQIQTLQAETESIRLQAASLTQRRDEATAEIESAQIRLDEAREEKQNATVHLSTLRGQAGMIERELTETRKKQQNMEWEKQNSEQRHQEASGRAEALETQLREAFARLESIQARRSDGQNCLEELRIQEGEVSSELNELKVKVATERQRHSSLHNQRAPMEARLGELQELISQRQLDIESYRTRAESTVAENAEIEANLESLRGSVGEAEARVESLQAERSGMVSAAEELAENVRNLRRDLTSCVDQRGHLEVRQTQLEMRATALFEHIQKRYQIDLHEFQRDLYGLRVAVRDQLKRQQRGSSGATDSAESETAAAAEGAETPAPTAEAETETAAQPVAETESFDVDWAVVDAMVKELDQRIDTMGPVNLDAIQEYDELEQRYNFLEKQNNDLTTSKQELLDVITKINCTTRELFADTFEKVRINFQEMFTELFGGGKANLVLLDESDPLESGIDIIAKPPGKQLTSISLLSGGEKTMTAVALLFSIYMVKPSPFCVLDEMDAPLDESNIMRFIKILDRFVSQSQFVVITHNKRTIGKADVLYGVTMEEHGVSKLVGVRFSQRDESSQSSDIIGTANPEARPPSIAETFGKTEALHSETLAG